MAATRAEPYSEQEMGSQFSYGPMKETDRSLQCRGAMREDSRSFVKLPSTEQLQKIPAL